MKIELRKLCLLRGMSYPQLADKTGISLNMIKYIGSGRRNPGLSNLIKIASVLNVKLDELVSYDDANNA